MAVITLRVFIICLFCITWALADCGRVPAQGGSKIVGGFPVDQRKYAWLGQLILKSNNQSNCGATLISQRYVVSAAHCYFGKTQPEKLYTILLGTNNLCKITPSAEYFDAERVIVHELYTPQDSIYDIALVRLTRDATKFTPICLPPAYLAIKPRIGDVLGFGVTDPSTGALPCTLQEARVTVYTKRECLLHSALTLTDLRAGTICAGKITGGVDSCQGDSGGPMQFISNEKYTLLGIVSFGYGCALKSYPGVYTDVSYYINWIRRNTMETGTRVSGAVQSNHDRKKLWWYLWNLGQANFYG